MLNISPVHLAISALHHSVMDKTYIHWTIYVPFCTYDYMSFIHNLHGKKTFRYIVITFAKCFKAWLQVSTNNVPLIVYL